MTAEVPHPRVLGGVAQGAWWGHPGCSVESPRAQVPQKASLAPLSRLPLVCPATPQGAQWGHPGCSVGWPRAQAPQKASLAPLSCLSLVFPASPISPGNEPHHFLPFSPAPWTHGQCGGIAEPSLPSSCTVERSSAPPPGSPETRVGNRTAGSRYLGTSRGHSRGRREARHLTPSWAHPG